MEAIKKCEILPSVQDRYKSGLQNSLNMMQKQRLRSQGLVKKRKCTRCKEYFWEDTMNGTPDIEGYIRHWYCEEHWAEKEEYEGCKR